MVSVERRNIGCKVTGDFGNSIPFCSSQRKIGIYSEPHRLQVRCLGRQDRGGKKNGLQPPITSQAYCKEMGQGWPGLQHLAFEKPEVSNGSTMPEANAAAFTARK